MNIVLPFRRISSSTCTNVADLNTCTSYLVKIPMSNPNNYGQLWGLASPSPGAQINVITGETDDYIYNSHIENAGSDLIITKLNSQTSQPVWNYKKSGLSLSSIQMNYQNLSPTSGLLYLSISTIVNSGPVYGIYVF